MASDAGKPPVTRLLSAGARGAERVAHVAGVDRAVDQAVEEAVVRALRSPAVARAIERAVESYAETAELNSGEIAQIIRRALESGATQQAWAEVLASAEAQTLVERIAGAPEIRAAIAAQSAGLITEIGVRLTRLTEALDDALERVVRHRDPDSETNQAGLATRLVAAGIDVGLMFVLYSIASSVLASVIPFVFGTQLSLPVAIVLGVVALITAGAILATFWALAGQTPGMRFLSIRLIYQDSRHVPVRVAIRRVGGVLVSLVPRPTNVRPAISREQPRTVLDGESRCEVVVVAALAAASPSPPSPYLRKRPLRTHAGITAAFDGVWTRLTPPARPHIPPVLSGEPAAPDTPSHSSNSGTNSCASPKPRG